jgi:uncharacterized phiE125 gp8 family phage protein
VPGSILTRIAPPVNSPVSLADLKAHLRVTSGDEDALIAACLDAAVAVLDAQGWLGRGIIAQTWSESFPSQSFSGVRLPLTLRQATELLAVDYRNADGVAQAATLADFTLYDGAENPFVLSDAWPSVGVFPDALTVTYRVGFGENAGDVPPPICQAIKLLAAHYFEIREPVVIGAVVTSVPMSVDALCNAYRVWF